MSWLSQTSIRKKLLALTLTVTTVALLVAAIALGVYQIVDGRRNVQQAMLRTAQLISENIAAAVTYSDLKVARETLQSLHAEPAVLAACVYKGNALFADYYVERIQTCPPVPQSDGARFDGSILNVYQPILLDGSRIGTLHLQTTLDPLYDGLRRQFLILLLIILGSTAVAYGLLSRVQKYLSEPILSLARTARNISENKDYSLRADQKSEDELGTLVMSFNDMLEQIQTRDAELMRSRELLEQRVQERTEELRKRNEELNRTNRDLDDFAYIASHDLKEPLRGIHNYASFLLEDYEDKLGEAAREQLLTLVRLSKSMEQIIDSLLDYSRIGRLELLATAVDLNQVVREVLESLSILLAEADIQVRSPYNFPTIRCDRAHVAEVFRNLISNAIKYNDKPNKWIEIGTAVRNDAPLFYVRDNGIGIPEKHRDAVFQIFKRLHSRDRFGGGTGAGLTIVKKIVERHNGSIWIDSSVGQGTTFYFTLPGEPT